MPMETLITVLNCVALTSLGLFVLSKVHDYTDKH